MASVTMCDSPNKTLLPCPWCEPRTPRDICRDPDELHCPRCESTQPFLRRPLFLVTGVGGAGKSTVANALANRRIGPPVFDTDMFDVYSGADWKEWANRWLLLAFGLAQNG